MSSRPRSRSNFSHLSTWLLFLRRLLPKITRLLTQYEKIILAALSVVIVLSGSIWFKQVTGNHPDRTIGGSYVEGIVGGQNEMGQVAARLTKVGLFTISDTGKLNNLLVTEWQANSEQTEYEFTLKEGIKADEIVDSITQHSDIIAPLQVENKDNKVVVTLSSANANLPLLLTQPIFDFGAYKLSKFTNQTSIFTRNTRDLAAPAYINKIIIHSYEDEAALRNALEKGKLNGAVTSPDGSSLEGYHQEQTLLPRYYAVLFNTNKTPFRELSFRKKIATGESGATTPFTLIVADREPYKALADSVVAKWRAAGVQVTLETKPFDEVRDKIIPSRNFQAILTGLDYGIENDPFYLWHSSQIRPPGNNLTGIKDEQIDKAIGEIEQTTDLAKRQELVTSVHQRLAELAVAIIIKQDSFNLTLSDDIRTAPSWLANSQYDHFLGLTQWSVR